MNTLKDSSEIREAVTLLENLVDQAAVVKPYYLHTPASTPPPDAANARRDRASRPAESKQPMYPPPDAAGDETLYRGDLLENTVVAMCKRGGFSGAVVADADGLSLAIYNSPVEEDALAAFTVVLGDALEKAGKVLNQQDASYISMDINYTEKVVLRRFLLDDQSPFYMMVICRQEIDEKDEVELSIDQIRTILKGK